jgi:hypothetical protein
VARYLGHLEEPEEGWTIHLLPHSAGTSRPLLSELEPLVPLEEDEEQAEEPSALSDEP